MNSHLNDHICNLMMELNAKCFLMLLSIYVPQGMFVLYIIGYSKLHLENKKGVIFLYI